MIRLLADANIQGQVEILVARMRSEAWRDFWEYLDLRHVTFMEISLDPSAPDSEVWGCCQVNGLILLTDNRNEDGPDSLEATIRSRNTPTSLPVFTIADVREVSRSSHYAERVVDRLFRYLLELENLRGTGRLFLP